MNIVSFSDYRPRECETARRSVTKMKELTPITPVPPQLPTASPIKKTHKRSRSDASALQGHRRTLTPGWLLGYKHICIAYFVHSLDI